MRKMVFLAVMVSLIAFIGPAPLQVIAEPSKIATAGDQLVRPDGAKLFLLGVNYVGSPDRSWTMWQDGLFNPGLVEQDFLKAKSTGLNTLRLFIRSPLPQELLAGQWGKLDTPVTLAEKHGLNLIVTFYDYREDDLAKVAALDRAIAQRYAGKRVVLAYNLKNEPQYQDLAIAKYPGAPPPLQTDVLISRYGERMKPAEVETWRGSEEGQRLIPARFSSHEAYIYANNYRLYLEFLKEAGDWVTARNYEVSTLDYIESPDSAKWGPLLNVLDETLAAWLKPQIEAVRSSDQERLITVGYSNAVLAKLSANSTLAYISIHRFPKVGLKELRITFDLLDDLRRAFPNKPVVFEEFGYSNESADPGLTALYETAILLQLMSRGMAGGAKWSLFDVSEGWNTREMNFGLYYNDGSPKPMANILGALGEYINASPLPAGKFSLDASPSASDPRYVYSAPDALFVAAPSYGDPAGRFSFEAPGVTQVFLSWPRGNLMNIASTAPANLRLNLGALLGVKNVGDLALQKTDGTPVPFQRQGDMVFLNVEAGQSYRLRLISLAVDARIEVVWPQDNKPVSEAERVNIGAYLFQQGTAAATCPELAPAVRLWRTLNNGVEEPVSIGQRRRASVGGLAFSAWDFNGVDVAAARDPRNKYYFRLSVDGYSNRSSIWSHGADARTYLPNPDVPSGVAAGVPQEVDAKIEVVWPQGNLPVDKASLANIGVYLFQRGTLQSVPADWSPTVRLWRALNNGYEEKVVVGQSVMKKAGGTTFPAWEFNNVDVSAARDPLNKYYFRVTVDGVNSRSNVWSHGADARTYFPQKDVPTGVNACS